MSKHDIAHSEDALGSPSSRGGKGRSCVRHCGRFWWAYVILVAVIIAIVVPVVILVAVPKIAQSKLDHAKLTVDGIAISNTTPNSYTMSINSTLRSDGQVKATIAPFSGVMYLEDYEPHTPFVRINFPQTKSVKLQIVNISQPIQIEDMEAFTRFNTWVQTNESLRVTIKGDTTVKVSGISKNYGVTFRNTITIKGTSTFGLSNCLNGFKGLSVTDSAVSLVPDARGDNFKGRVSIPNPSVLTLEIGNASFSNLLEGRDIGTVFIDNLVLRPGDNNVSMRANITQAPVLAAIQKRPYCQDGIIQFELRGKNVSNGGQRLSYFADALSVGSVTTNIDIGSTLKQSLNLTVACGPAS
ncbi:hypothetical protein C8035_v000345 [Colletotrichum spinosum]|uniref:Uncharacterized protein n=1 Tax=Colletotrichum spinosum TaxID=1347390 RepID=A0A4V6QE86_9PEZI|nr:hypothetical protein C8035_v000345 [Colletotrichum spinosum]